MRYLLLLLLTVSHLSAMAQGRPQLQVRGVGHLKSQPDVAILSIELKTIQKEFSDAVSALESEYGQMLRHLENEGFSTNEIKTSHYGIRPNRIYTPSRSYDSGFVGTHDLIVELRNAENLAKTTTAFSKSPVKAQLNITFTVSDSLRQTIRNEIIKRAIEDAGQKAKLMAEASGRQLGKIVNITYGSGSTGQDHYYENYDLDLDYVHIEEITPQQVVYTVKELSFEDEVMIAYALK